MKITPVNTTKFTGFGTSDMKKFVHYTLRKQQGSMYELHKKFEPDLINVFSNSGKIHIDKTVQNWKADDSLRGFVFKSEEKTLEQKIKDDKKLIASLKVRGKINF